MDIVNIPKRYRDVNQIGGLWSIDVEIPTSSTSDAYVLPINPIYAVGLEWTGAGLNPAIQFTFASNEEIEADTAVWTAWNKTAEINLAITAIRFVNASSTVVATAKIIIKGSV